MRSRCGLSWCGALLAVAACGGTDRGAPAVPESTAAGAPAGATAIAPPRAVLAATTASATETRFRNVNFHVAPHIVLHIVRLRGAMRSKRSGSPIVFDDKRSFIIGIDTAEVGLSMESLAHLMNDHVFAYRGAPLHDLRFSTDGDRLVQRGTLHKGVNIPFEITATMSVTPAGWIRIHPVKIKAFKISGKGLLDALGIQLADLLDVKKATGVQVSGDDLLLDPTRILPPPTVEGYVTAVRVTKDEVVQSFGRRAGARKRVPALAPPDSSARNYMYFQGGTLRFGKLFMVYADMQIIDLDPRDPFDFSIDEYNRQLVAGYSKNQPDHGLEVFMPDLGQVASKESKGVKLR